MDQNIWEYDDFIFKGDELKGMTQKGKDKVKLEGKTDLVIPELTPDGLPLKKIADNAFYRRGLTSVVIPNTVESIGYDAFGVCKLKEVKLPEALVNIEGFAFYRNKLTKVEFGSKVKRLEPSSFAMNELAEVSEPEKTEVDLTALETHEQAELTERLSDYYSPDDVELQPAPKSEAKS